MHIYIWSMGGTDLPRRFKPRCVHRRCYATNAGNNHDQAQRISLSWATLPPIFIYIYIYVCVCVHVYVRIVRYIYIYMIDCSLHGAMMSKHKVPTSFRPPSLRPQVYLCLLGVWFWIFFSRKVQLLTRWRAPTKSSYRIESFWMHSASNQRRVCRNSISFAFQRWFQITFPTVHPET